MAIPDDLVLLRLALLALLQRVFRLSAAHIENVSAHFGEGCDVGRNLVIGRHS